MQNVPNPAIALRRPAPLADLAVRFAPERPADQAGVDALIADAFGPGRFAKTAERLRERATRRPDLSLCAFGDSAASREALSGEALVGAVRLWSIRIGPQPALFLGPIAVRRDRRRYGLGASLVLKACEAARRAGDPAVLLVGEPAVFESQGFLPVPAGRVVLPGPVDPHRLMWRALRPGALEGLEGAVTGAGLPHPAPSN